MAQSGTYTTIFRATQIRILSEMLNLQPWRNAPLTLHFFNSSYLGARTGCPPLPAHVRLDVAPMEVNNISITGSLNLQCICN